MSPLNCPIDEYKRIMMEFTSSEDLLSLHFGRTFWLNDEGEFCSAPTYKDGNTDWDIDEIILESEEWYNK